MDITERLYGLLQRDGSYPVDISIEDLVGSKCTYQLFLRALGQEPTSPEEGHVLMLREIIKGIRAMVRGYLKDAFKERYRPPKKFTFEGMVDVEIDGWVDDWPVYVVPIPDVTWERVDIPKWVRLRAAAKAIAIGADAITVILINRNTQGWRAFSISGDWARLEPMLRGEASYLASLLTFDALSLTGTDNKGECKRCAFEPACDANRTVKLDPFPLKDVTATPDTLIIQELENYLRKKAANSGSGRATHCIHPSEISTVNCDRAIAYGLLGTEKKRKKTYPKMQRVFDAGHVVHDIAQGLLGRALDDFEAEVPMPKNKYNIVGHCDGQDGTDGFEIKSCSEKEYEKLTKAKKDHVEQATIYGTLLKLLRIHYLYICKEHGNIKAFPTQRSPAVWHRVAQRAESIIKTVNAGQLPPQVDTGCKSCKYAWTCKPELVEKPKEAS